MNLFVCKCDAPDGVYSLTSPADGLQTASRLFKMNIAST